MYSQLRRKAFNLGSKYLDGTSLDVIVNAFYILKVQCFVIFCVSISFDAFVKLSYLIIIL